MIVILEGTAGPYVALLDELEREAERFLFLWMDNPTESRWIAWERARGAVLYVLNSFRT